MDISGTDSNDETTTPECGKRKALGRLTEVKKKLLASSHEIGENCKCIRYRCFTHVGLNERKRIIREFNSLSTYNAQNQYLSGLVTVTPVQRRRNRKNEEEANFRKASFQYRIRTLNPPSDVQVCVKAFVAIHGITERRVNTIREALIISGLPPSDGRGKHSNRPHKLPDSTKQSIHAFIKSIKGRKSHYSLKDSQKLYFPEDLNVSKLVAMYNKEKNSKVSYDTFRQIFTNDFNISFGYPRKDTCSICDKKSAEISVLQTKITELEGSNRRDKIALEELRKEKQTIQTDLTVHKARGGKFYEIKRKCRMEASKKNCVESIAMDYQKNLPTPNITTNDVYYRRQLNFVSFNIHVLSTNSSYFYTYDESVAKKGSDDVCSMLYDFVTNKLSSDIRELDIFCDSCAGQNKNYTVIRFLHFLTTKLKRFDCVRCVFPIRGHSYLECDRDMSIINQKSYVEVPDDWRDVIRNSRTKPNPFNVIDCKSNLFDKWSDFLAPFYKKKCPIPTRPIREIKFQIDHPKLVYHRDTYSGAFQTMDITVRTSSKKLPSWNAPRTKLYNGPIPLNPAKKAELLHLTQFLTKNESRMFYNNLTAAVVASNDAVQDDDILSSCTDEDD